jgi:alkanesulfonate monooxygenase SsuD/methylene tetrahydromethanopterin reductase-like flavin-dependent oxidoreductase (luciferase family)
MPNFSFGFDMRAPDIGPPAQRLYSEAIAMCAYAETRGISYVTVMEHHGAKDGYLPTPFLLGAAIAARTEKMKIQHAAVLLPLHDPVKLAEQIAVVDIISNGRAEIVFGAGYVASEFAMFRRSVHERAKAMDAGIPVIQRALSGERFKDADREVFVRPLPLQKPYPPLFLGGGVPATAKRAARFGLGLYPMHPSVIPIYKDECAKQSRKPGPIVFSMVQMHISDDPERTWSQVGPHVLHVARSYAEWTEGASSSSPYAGLTTLDAVRKSGIYQILTPDEAVRLCTEADKIGADLALAPLMGGMDPQIGWESIHMLINKVLPRVKKSEAA